MYVLVQDLDDDGLNITEYTEFVRFMHDLRYSIKSGTFCTCYEAKRYNNETIEKLLGLRGDNN